MLIEFSEVMSLTRLKSFCQARRISSAVGSHWPSWVRSSHNDGRFKHCCIERNQVLTPRSRNLSTGRCLTNETVTPYYDAGDSSLRHSAEIARNTLALPDKEANEGKRKLRTALAEYSLDDDGYMNVRDVVSFLKQENAVDICVIKATGNKRSYVEFLVVVSGVSTRHLRAMAKNLEEMVSKRGCYEYYDPITKLRKLRPLKIESVEILSQIVTKIGLICQIISCTILSTSLGSKR